MPQKCQGKTRPPVDPIAENAFGNPKLWQMDGLFPQQRIADILILVV